MSVCLSVRMSAEISKTIKARWDLAFRFVSSCAAQVCFGEGATPNLTPTNDQNALSEAESYLFFGVLISTFGNIIPLIFRNFE